jgi:hypothetical protein
VSKNKRLALERARQAMAAQRRAEARRRRLMIAGAAVAAVVLVVGILIVVKLTGGSGGGSATPAPSASPAASAVLSAVTSVPPETLDKVGTGKVAKLPSTLTGQPALTDGGKPLVVYIGAEYCPFCAAQRWAVVVALSRFGTFTGLGQTFSSSSDVYPNTPTLSFHGASYTSQYLAFQGVETETNQRQGNGYAPLDTLSPQQQDLLKKYDAPPYVDANSAGAIPFIDFANQAVIAGASLDPQLLAGKTHQEIAAALSDPNSQIAQAVDGTANAFTNLLCQLTKGQPATVCTSSAATAYQGKFHAAG